MKQHVGNLQHSLRASMIGLKFTPQIRYRSLHSTQRNMRKKH